GYSHKEIGKELDITESSSRSQLTRARKMLVGLLTRTEISNV
ncbi:MAG: DNA-directed RNA polymerase specialized sigma24 family protein, partial [Crocinitomicaceae bacterium]